MVRKCKIITKTEFQIKQTIIILSKENQSSTDHIQKEEKRKLKRRKYKINTKKNYYIFKLLSKIIKNIKFSNQVKMINNDYIKSNKGIKIRIRR